MKIISALAGVAFLAASVTAASASTTFTPITDWTGYNFAQSGDLAGGAWESPKAPLTSSTTNINLSPFATGTGANPSAEYYAIGPLNGGASAVLSFGAAVLYNFSFVWGSVDDYNTIEFLDAAYNPVLTVLGSALGPPKTSGAQLAEFINIAGFSKVRFSSSQEAFEIGSITASVPVPAGVFLLGSGLAGLGLLGRRFKKSSKTAMAAA